MSTPTPSLVLSQVLEHIKTALENKDYALVNDLSVVYQRIKSVESV